VYFKTKTGTFEAENLNGSVGGSNMGTIAADSTAGFSNLNYLRTVIGDTDSSFPLFTDNELEGWIDFYTTDDVVSYLRAASICLKALSVDPDRISALADKLGGAMTMITLMDQCWSRAEALAG